MTIASQEQGPLADYPDLGDKAYELLKADIHARRLAPGSRLSTVGLAQRLGISRTPIKVALSRLAVEGFVEDVARKGYFVARLDAETIAELLSARLLLEVAAVEGTHGTMAEADLEIMQQLVAEMDQFVDEQGRYRDAVEFSKRDLAFHLTIVGAAKNRILVDTYRTCYFRLYPAGEGVATEASVRRGGIVQRLHKSILESWRARDVSAIKEALAKHMHQTREWRLATASSPLSE